MSLPQLDDIDRFLLEQERLGELQNLLERDVACELITPELTPRKRLFGQLREILGSQDAVEEGFYELLLWATTYVKFMRTQSSGSSKDLEWPMHVRGPVGLRENWERLFSKMGIATEYLDPDEHAM